MQKVAAYRLERRVGTGWAEVRADEVQAIRGHITSWLESKGALTPNTGGEFKPEDGGVGRVSVSEAEDADRSWWMVKLDETSPKGRRVVTCVSVTSLPALVAVYVTLETGSAGGTIAPVEVGVKCPKIVRDLLKKRRPWHYGASEYRPLHRIKGFAQGEGLAQELTNPERMLPYVVVTCGADGHPVMPDIQKNLAHDLAGVANVAVIDSAATYALTDHLGRDLSCFEGAIRVYWPRLSRNRDPFRHPMWTAANLRGAGPDLEATRERLRAQLRRLLMTAACHSVIRPQEIDDIRASASRAAFERLTERATSREDWQGLAESYSKDNEELRKRIKDLEGELLQSRDEEREAKERVAALMTQVENAELQLRYREEGSEDAEVDLLPDTGTGVEVVRPPEPKEVRYYKKLYDAGNHDVLNRVKDCGCNNWESAHKADKARKGILKLEAREEFRSLQHCASCKGGGMWKVTW